MKIALDATYSLGEDLSGIGVYSRELLAGLAAAHPEAAFRFCYRPHRFLRSLREPLPPNCRRGLLQEPWGPRTADLFHGMNQRLPRMRLRRAVTTFHDLFVLTGEYSTPEFRRRFAEQARHAAAESHAIITVSEFTAGQVEQLLGVDPARIHVVRHGVRPLPYTGDGPFQGRGPQGQRAPVFLHVGTIQRRKNLGRLVTAFEKTASPWRLVLAGSNGYGAAEILEQIKRSPARQRIQVLGYVAPQVLQEWYGRAAVLAFPSLDEGFGLPVIEAMAHGVAVLTSNRAALPEVAGDAALLVNPESAEEIAEGLLLLTRDEGLRQTLTHRGLLRARDFTWTEAVERTWKVYQGVL